MAVHQLRQPFLGRDITAVAGMEARGFIFGSLIAWELGLPFIPLRKPGKLPYEVQSVEYNLEYADIVNAVVASTVKTYATLLFLSGYLYLWYHLLWFYQG